MHQSCLPDDFISTKFFMKLPSIRITLILLFTSSLALAQRNADLDKKIAAFDLYAESGRKQWDIPGMALLVVKDGKVVFKKGYGVRELGKSDPVNSETLFSCASTTKAMTAACIGILVDEGKLKWDDPVIKYLPEYQLYDPYVTRELRIRDLLIHNSGVGNADFFWTAMDIPADEILKKMQMVKPSYSFRSGFIYQNIFYIAAGKVIEKVSGMSWDNFLMERIFTPLGMSRAVPSRKYIRDDNQAKPHFKIEGKIQVIGNSPDASIGPAGAVWASIDDMGKWVVCMLDSSKYGSGRLLKKETWIEMFKPQTIVPANEFYPTQQLTKPNWTTYGLAWFQHDYRGKKLNFHTGSLAGLTAINAQIPELKTGFYIFENYDHAELRHALMYKAFDVFAFNENRDWSTEFFNLYKGIREKREKTEKDFESKRVTGTKPSLPLESYAGKYSDPLYGKVDVTVKDNKLLVNFNNFISAEVEHWHYDTFRGWYGDKWDGKCLITFSIGAEGTITSGNFDGFTFKKEK